MKALTASQEGGADFPPAAARQVGPVHAGNLSGEIQGEPFSMAETRRIVADLFVHRPAVYWTDFLLTASVGYAAAGAYFFVPLGWAATLVCFVVAGFTLFRAATFIHEIVHMRQGLMPWFQITWNVLFGVLVGSVAVGPLSGMLLVRVYLLAVFTVGLNWLRNLAAHRFRNEGGELSVVGQLLDSVTVVGHPIWTELFFPLGLRYHALHHLFPSLPYHALPEAHRRLMAQLPVDSPYRRTIEPTFCSALRRLWAEARTRETKNSP